MANFRQRGGIKMIQQIEKSHRWTDDPRRREALTRKETSEPVFFFHGDFRTWGQMQLRVQFNLALAHGGGSAVRGNPLPMLSPVPAAPRINFAEAYCDFPAREDGGGTERSGRSCTVLNQHAGETDIRTMMALLGDHSDGENLHEPICEEMPTSISICVYYTGQRHGNTAASLVADFAPTVPDYRCTGAASTLPAWVCSCPCLSKVKCLPSWR